MYRLIRWAFHGVDFLYHAASPNFTRHLTADEFAEFKSAVEACYAHIIGEEDPAAEAGGGGGGTSRAGSAGSSRSPRTPMSPGSSGFSRSNSRSRDSRPTSPNGRLTPGGGGGVRGGRTVSESGEELEASERLAKLQMPPPTSPFV